MFLVVLRAGSASADIDAPIEGQLHLTKAGRYIGASFVYKNTSTVSQCISHWDLDPITSQYVFRMKSVKGELERKGEAGERSRYSQMLVYVVVPPGEEVPVTYDLGSQFHFGRLRGQTIQIQMVFAVANCDLVLDGTVGMPLSYELEEGGFVKKSELKAVRDYNEPAYPEWAKEGFIAFFESSIDY